MKKSEIATAFSNGEFEKAFPYLTDKTIWNTVGEKYLIGGKEIEKFCKNIIVYFNSVSTRFQQLNLIENENAVAINGTAEFLKEGKRISFISSCDVYEFDKFNHIISIHSYCITEKK